MSLQTSLSFDDRARYRLSPDVRANPATADGRVVMHVRHGRMLLLNGLGATIWEGLERRASLDDIVSGIASTHEVAPDVARRDTVAFLAKLAERQLIDVDETPAAPASVASTPVPSPLAPRLDAVTIDAAATMPSRFLIAAAFVGFALVDAMTSFRRFKTIHAVVRRWPTRTTRTGRPADAATAIRTRAAVERAEVWYPRRSMCLQRSTVLTCLLRQRGIPADLVFGARTIPFYAHAWVEVGGQVFNDDEDVRQRFPAFDRC